MITIVARDTTTLPGLLLDGVKRHARVEYNTDDEDLVDMVGAAIEHFERYSMMTINPTTYRWAPEQALFDAGGDVLVPVTPVGTFTAAAGSPAVDVSADYSVYTSSIHGVAQYYLAGAYASGLALTIVSGFAIAALPAGIRRTIFQAAATLYEYRETITPSNLDQMPGWLNEVMAGYWLPRC